MAEADQVLDYDYVEAVPEELACSICTRVLCEPHLMNCCEQQFCKDCLEKWLQDHDSCPHCRSSNFSHMFLQQTSRKAKQLKVYCPNRGHGCKDILKVGECEEHLSTTNKEGCLYVKLKCPYHCSAQIFRGKMKTHTQKECPRRSVPCLHCGLLGEYQHIMGGHEKECPMFPLSCPRGCKDTVLRKNLNVHQEVCLLEPVDCPFSMFGCKSKILRKDLEKHVQANQVQHMSSFVKSHAMLQNELATLKDEHKALQAENSALKESYAAKMQAIEPIVTSIPYHPDHCQLAQIYTIMVDTSTVKLGDSVYLVLSESNWKFGQHNIILLPFQVKFKLEWSIEESSASKHSVVNLYATSNFPPTTPRFSIKIYLSQSPSILLGDFTLMQTSPCAKQSGLLIKCSLDWQLKKKERIEIRYVRSFASILKELFFGKV